MLAAVVLELEHPEGEPGGGPPRRSDLADHLAFAPHFDGDVVEPEGEPTSRSDRKVLIRPDEQVRRGDMQDIT